MNIENPAEELIRRYLKAVERYLPLNKRADISKEIESMIYDICEERYQNMEIDEKRMESILVELGKPSRLAAKFKENHPLIGPELTPIFKLVVFIVCLVTAIASMLNFALSVSGMSAGKASLYLLELFSSLTGVVGTIFIIFFILERAIKNKSEIDFDDDGWKVKDLPEVKEKLPGRAEIIATFIFAVIGIFALNFFIDYIGIYNFGAKFSDGDYGFVPVLTGKFKELLPLFSVRIAVGALVLLPLISGFEIIKTNKLQYYYQYSQIGLIFFDIGIIILMLSQGFAVFFIPEAFDSAGLENLINIARNIYNGILIVLLALSGWSLIKRTLVILPKGRVL